RRVTPTFDPTKAAALWRTSPAGTDSTRGPVAAWPKPPDPVRGLSLNGLDSVPEAMRVQEKAGIQVDSVTIAFGQDYLLLQDLATIFLINQNLGERPSFFRASYGGY